MHQVVNIYTSQHPSLKVCRVATELGLSLPVGTTLAILPLSQLKQAPKGRQQLLALQADQRDVLKQVNYLIQIGEANPLRYADDLARLRADRNRLETDLLNTARQLGEEGGREL